MESVFNVITDAVKVPYRKLRFVAKKEPLHLSISLWPVYPGQIMLDAQSVKRYPKLGITLIRIWIICIVPGSMVSHHCLWFSKGRNSYF